MCSVVTRWQMVWLVTQQTYSNVLRRWGRICGMHPNGAGVRFSGWASPMGEQKRCLQRWALRSFLCWGQSSRAFSAILVTVFWLNLQNVSERQSLTFQFQSEMWLFFSVLFKGHPINSNLGDLYILWATLCSLPPTPHHKASASVLF